MVLSTILILTFSVAAVSYAWFVLINRTDSFVATAAKIDVSYEIYLDGQLITPSFYVIQSNQSTIKSGVYQINVSDMNAANYIENLRIDIVVKSTVDTYLRVALIDSLTLATLDFQGNRGEVAIVDQPINYATARSWLINDMFFDNIAQAEAQFGELTSDDDIIMLPQWFNHSFFDGYYYYPEKIIRTPQMAPLTIPFIEAYDGSVFRAKPLGYQLQFAIIVEGIQANHHAPIYNWRLNNPPWSMTEFWPLEVNW